MRKKYLIFLALGCVIIAATVWAQDQVTISTYYPAPYGIYQDLVVTNSLGIGTTTPQTALDIIGASAVIRMENTSAGNYWEIAPNNNGRLYIYSEAYGGTVMSLTTNGYVGIGVVNPSRRLELPNTAGVGGEGLANSWTIYSSRRWKENITELDAKDALEKVKKLRPVHFTWKPEHGGCEDIGFIAEEVGEIIPEAVSWEDEERKFADSLDTQPIIAYLTRAVQCRQDEIEMLKKELDELFEEIVEEEKTEEESAGLDE